MRVLPKSWSLQINNVFLIGKKQGVVLCLLFFISGRFNSQIANYVVDGGFEKCKNCNQASYPTQATYWKSIDSSKYCGILLTEDPPSGLVPKSSYTYQWPVHGHNYLASPLLFKPSLPQTTRGYPRNTLKQTLQAGKTYCVKFYCSLTNQSSYAVDGLGAYFGDASLDTITQCDKPISYLTPQIQYTGGYFTDTLNWVPITGTFVANGTEKYMMLGNFKSDASTNRILVNPTNSVVVFTDILYDDVSVIDIDLPAFAGRDTFFIPGDSVFLGRTPDVGIDEACTWYQLPASTPIDTVAGFWVKPSGTTTYVVKQDICGFIKYDTVTVYLSAIGIKENQKDRGGLSIYPQPAEDLIYIALDIPKTEGFKLFTVVNSLGETVKQEEINFVNGKATVSIKSLSAGIYFVKLSGADQNALFKPLIIEH